VTSRLTGPNASVNVAFTKTTKFNDLPNEIRKVLEDIEYVVGADSTVILILRAHSSHIQGQLQISKELKQRKLGEESTKGHELIRDLHKVWSLLSCTKLVLTSCVGTH